MQLRRKYRLIINKKKVYRLCKELDILRPQRQKRISYPRKLARNHVITASYQLWQTDTKYGFIEGEQRFFFVCSFIDVYDRSIIDYHIGLSCSGQDVKHALQRVLWKRKQFNKKEKPVIRSDNGPQFISHAFEQGCEEFQTEHERIPPKTPNINAHIESFHRILEDECFSRVQFQTYEEAYTEVATFMKFYNERRMHSSILDLSLQEFYEKQGFLVIKEVWAQCVLNQVQSTCLIWSGGYDSPYWRCQLFEQLASW